MSENLSLFKAEMRERGVYGRGKRDKFANEIRTRVALRGGGATYGEGKAARAERLNRESWQALVESVTRACHARIALLASSSRDALECPWKAIYNGLPCRDMCVCGGTGSVTTSSVIRRYEQLVRFLTIEIRRRA